MTSWIPFLVVSSPLALCDKGFGRGPPGGLGQYSSGAGSGGSFGAASDFGGAGIDAGALEDTIPGIPGEDYPIYAVPPETSFFCDGQVDGGYYGDPEAECQAFHICANDGNSGLTKFSFLCPNGTLFQQQYFVCDWWFNVDCSTTEDFYGLNDQIAASSPSGGQGQYGGARSSAAGGQSSGRRGASSRRKSGSGKKSRKGSQASASAPRGSYSSPSSSSSSYSAPSSGYQSGQDTSGAGSGYGSPSNFGGSSGADAAYGAPPGYSRRRNARGTNLVVEESAEEKGEDEEE
jgi:hypothetical protein